MASLPVHSHHRAPLLKALSQHLPSSTAATLLHAAPSTIRNAKRKDYSMSDLVQHCQWMWHWLSVHKCNNKRISHHFFASYHGHSLADAHAASIKRNIRTEYNMSQLQRFDTSTLAIYWGPENAAALGRLISKCSNTEICVIPHIDRDPALKPDPIPLVHIKRQHRFDYENGLCYRSELSEGTEKKRFSFQLRPASAIAPTTH